MPVFHAVTETLHLVKPSPVSPDPRAGQSERCRSVLLELFPMSLGKLILVSHKFFIWKNRLIYSQEVSASWPAVLIWFLVCLLDMAFVLEQRKHSETTFVG